MKILAYKLFRKRKDNTYGPLFINRKQKLTRGITYTAEDHPTEGYAHRPGWHCCAQPVAPHLSIKERVWCVVEIKDFKEHIKPKHQGGLWYTANKLTILQEL